MPGIEGRSVKGGTRYVVRVRDPQRGKFTSATYATRPEAEQFVRDVDQRGVAWALSEYHRAKGQAEEPTLDEWAELHFRSLTEPSDDTVERYRRIYASDWKPALGHMRLSQIERTDVAAALNQLGGSDKTRANKWAVLTHMLKMAAQDGMIARSPTIGIRLGRRTEHEREEHRYLTHGEFWAVLNATPAYWRPLVLTLAGTGMRWGELAALTVGDIDAETSAVRITKAIKADGKLGPPKTGKSRRTIIAPSEVLDVLEPLMEGRKRTDRLFVPPKGGELRHRTFYRDIWLKKSVGESGIRQPYPRLHDLRHSHVAWLIAAGVSLPVIQARLGHEKITTTIDTYGHLVPDIQRAAAEAASVVLGARPLELA
jgi:integrase